MIDKPEWLRHLNTTAVNTEQANTLEKLEPRREDILEIQGPFTLKVADGYATVYAGNGAEVSVLADIELGWADTLKREYFTVHEESIILQHVVDLMNLGWKVKKGEIG